jgi:hypothetical protein
MHENPFVVSLLAADARCADREAEVGRIAEAFRTSGGKLVVYGDRRFGKSSALERAAETVRQEGGRVAIASLATASDESEAAQRVVSAAQGAVGSGWREVIEAVAGSMRRGLEVTPSIDPTGLPSVRLSLGADERPRGGRLLPDVLNALNEQIARRKLVLGLGLDEFQRINEWGGEDAEWSLREALQRHDAIGYVLAGSKRHLIEAMVSVKGRALWKLADVLQMDAISPEVLARWIVTQAGGTGVRIPDLAAEAIVRLAGPRTRDVVQLARAVWAGAQVTGVAGPAFVPAAFEEVVLQQAELYRAIFVKLSVRQQGVLRAFATDAAVQITSAASIRRFRLGPKSSVQSTVESLVGDEHLARGGSGGYGFDDPFFRRWVQTFALADIGEVVPPLDV